MKKINSHFIAVEVKVLQISKDSKIIRNHGKLVFA